MCVMLLSYSFPTCVWWRFITFVCGCYSKNVSLLSSAANPVYEQFTPPEMKQGRYKTISENSLRDIDMDLFQSQRSPVSQEESLQDKYAESNFVEDTTVKHRRIPSSKERSPGKVVSEAQRSKKEENKETALDQPHTPNTKNQPGEKAVTPRQTLAVREKTPVETSVTPRSRPKIPADYKAKQSDTPKLKPPPPSSRGSSPRTTRKSALASSHLSPEKDDESAKPRTPKAQRYVDFLTPESHHTPKSKMKTSSSNVEGASKTKKASSQKITRAKSHQFQLKREMEYNEIDTILRDAQKLFS